MSSLPPHPILDTITDTDRAKALDLINANLPPGIAPPLQKTGAKSPDFRWSSLDAPIGSVGNVGPRDTDAISALVRSLNGSRTWRHGGDGESVAGEVEAERAQARQGVALLEQSGRHWLAAALQGEADRVEGERAQAAEQLLVELQALGDERAAVEARCDDIRRHLAQLGPP